MLLTEYIDQKKTTVQQQMVCLFEKKYFLDINRVNIINFKLILILSNRFTTI